MSRDHEHLDLPPPDRPDPLARALAALEPAPPALNRDRLMFEAGAASRRPVIRLWQLTAGLLAAIGFAAGLNWRPLAGVREQAAAGQTGPARPEAAAVVEPSPRRAIPAEPPPRPTPGSGYWLRREHDALSLVLTILPDRSRSGQNPPPAG
ncbi:MAG: hypothetical protein K2X82_02450 [Gemmataceae bacterium]|nr:hypothetical protein [Gemmataceae bacterium]